MALEDRIWLWKTRNGHIWPGLWLVGRSGSSLSHGRRELWEFPLSLGYINCCKPSRRADWLRAALVRGPNLQRSELTQVNTPFWSDTNNLIGGQQNPKWGFVGLRTPPDGWGGWKVRALTLQCLPRPLGSCFDMPSRVSQPKPPIKALKDALKRLWKTPSEGCGRPRLAGARRTLSEGSRRHLYKALEDLFCKAPEDTFQRAPEDPSQKALEHIWGAEVEKYLWILGCIGNLGLEPAISIKQWKLPSDYLTKAYLIEGLFSLWVYCQPCTQGKGIVLTYLWRQLWDLLAGHRKNTSFCLPPVQLATFYIKLLLLW